MGLQLLPLLLAALAPLRALLEAPIRILIGPALEDAGSARDSCIVWRQLSLQKRNWRCAGVLCGDGFSRSLATDVPAGHVAGPVGRSTACK